MPFSMFSQSKKEDRKFLLDLADLIEKLVQVGSPQSLALAEMFGEQYLALEIKINTHDYSPDDKFIEQITTIIK